jgi:hypothetical protein
MKVPDLFVDLLTLTLTSYSCSFFKQPRKLEGKLRIGARVGVGVGVKGNSQWILALQSLLEAVARDDEESAIPKPAITKQVVAEVAFKQQ